MSCDRSVRRSAQDDDFVGACNIAVWMGRKDEREKVTGSQDDVFLGELEMQKRRPCGTHVAIDRFPRRLMEALR